MALRLVVVMALFGLTGCGESSPIQAAERAFPNRTFAAVTWDTVLMIGSPDPNDTTLISPSRVLPWGDRLVVSDGRNRRIHVLSEEGDLLWSHSRRGEGPGEFGLVNEIFLSPDGDLWVFDTRNQKIIELGHEGNLQREITLRGFPVVPSAVTPVGDRFVWRTQTSEYGLLSTNMESLEIESISPLPWKAPLDYRTNLGLVGTAPDSEGGPWALAFELGPGFSVIRGDSVVSHEYIDPIPFAIKPSPAITEMRGDSARYGARSISQVRDELFILFGGRPYRAAHSAEPTVLIDVYGLDGGYRRSYLVPDSHFMRTDDGQTFFLLTRIDDIYPALLALRPKAL